MKNFDYEIQIKRTKDGKILDTYMCNDIVAATDMGNFSAGNIKDFSSIMSYIASLIENQFLNIIQREVAPEDRAYMFKDIPNKWPDKEDQAAIQKSFKDTLSLLVNALNENLYHHTFEPDKDSHKIQVLNGYGDIIHERESSDFGFVAAYDSGVSTFFDEFENLSTEDTIFKIHQTICNCISFATKMTVCIENDITNDKFQALLDKGDEKAYNLLNTQIKTFFESMLDFYRTEKFTNRMHANGLNMIIDEEEYRNQMIQKYMKEFYKKLGFSPDDEEDDS